MKPKLIFSDRDTERVKLLQQGFETHSRITARLLSAHEVRRLPNLDAFYLSIMAAERWGARPIVHEVQVLRTTPKDQSEGWPAFVIAGLALREGEDPFDARFGLSLLIRAVLKAVKNFNVEGGDTISGVGFESSWTGIDRLPALEAAQIICAAYDDAPE